MESLPLHPETPDEQDVVKLAADQLNVPPLKFLLDRETTFPRMVISIVFLEPCPQKFLDWSRPYSTYY